MVSCKDKNGRGQEQQRVNEQNQDQKSHNSLFFFRADTDGSRQSFDGSTQEEDEQGKWKEEEDAKGNMFINQENAKEDIDNRNGPDHDTDQHRDLDCLSVTGPNRIWQEQQRVNKQDQDQKSHNSLFFFSGDTDGCRQSFKSSTQEEDEQGKRKEEEDAKESIWILINMPENAREDIDNRDGPDHGTDLHRDPGSLSVMEPKWPGNDQVPVTQARHIKED
ncbi:hypothetical protein Q5P01_021829 [Channa striata]|uniref:Uncharacterized protein n=1 Tax=Channa striata TaxID=64152 RepID=A0AA88LUT4_CHASR|nr:hypothetical protein Q5P01_021829 [Channa striata]